MIVLGVTGGIASGKSTVASMFCHAGDMHINADTVVHELFENNADMIAAIARAFPEAVSEQTIARDVLGGLVAQSPAALKKLESIVHPAVRAEQKRRIERARNQGCALVVLDVPLMFESGADALCDKVATVQAGPAIQKERALAREGMTQKKLTALMARQLSDAERAARADKVIRTDGSLEETQRAVENYRAELFS